MRTERKRHRGPGRARRCGATRSLRSSPARSRWSRRAATSASTRSACAGIRWHTVVSTGNQTVCDASDWLDALAGLPEVRSVALFLEADGDGARLAEALALCAERDVGVAVLKVGASQAGAVAAAAHTGSLAGDQRIFRALVEEAGAAWAEDPHELLELARALAEPRARPASAASAGCRKAAQGTLPSDTRRKTARGLAVLTCSGATPASRRPGRPARHRAAPLGPATRGRLEALLPPAAIIANPLDYTAMIWGDADRLARIIQAVGDDAAIDQLLLCYDHPRDLSRESEASWAAVREGIVQGAKQARAGTLVCSTSRT